MIVLDQKKALEEQLKALELEYVARLPEKSRVIMQAWRDLQQGKFDQVKARELFRLTHNLAGSGGLFGFSGITDIAREIEQLLSRVVDDKHLSASTSTGLESLFVQLEEVLETFSNPK